MYDSTVRSQKNPSSHHVTVTGQKLCMGGVRAEQ